MNMDRVFHKKILGPNFSNILRTVWMCQYPCFTDRSSIKTYLCILLITKKCRGIYHSQLIIIYSYISNEKKNSLGYLLVEQLILFLPFLRT